MQENFGLKNLTAILSLLDSNHDGEILAAVAALKRVMQSNKLEWKDIGVIKPIASEGYSRGPYKNDYPRRPPPRQEQDEPWQEVAKECLRSSRVSPREMKFLDSILHSGFSTLTEKQEAWLNSIACRVRGL